MHSSLGWYSVADTWAQNKEGGPGGVEKVNIPANFPIAFLDEVKDMEKTMKKAGATLSDMTPLFDLSNVCLHDSYVFHPCTSTLDHILHQPPPPP